ncbi:zinc-dependent alcohol dehydrogenase family protein [Ruegeria sp. HKCCD8929]|uniref:zinc-dependent alcohol dehydrogenase family protein n=1 Tax=Ruegeria sp. HKCCD8929 TaxID=2683006 RepID=UPI0020C3F62B|nr:zinc-dependent alcohol dehydrogenase family protein [Ruegeria sp. HKCCD8929]
MLWLQEVQRTERKCCLRAMVFDGKSSELQLSVLPIPAPGAGQVQVRVEACGVCRTDLHIVDQDLKDPVLPLIPGHEIVGRVSELGVGVDVYQIGQRVGIPWLGHTCGTCDYCRSQRENLCDAPGFTGYTINGGYAEYCVADSGFVFPLPEDKRAEELAPLLCAGLIGYRSFKMAGNPKSLGIYGFGAAAHILCQVAKSLGIDVYAFTRDNDCGAQQFALELGAKWAGGASQNAPVNLDASIIFAPVGALVPTALKTTRKGGRVVCGGIHMSDIPSFPYADLWEERSIRSVANLTREDGEEFFELVSRALIEIRVVTYPIERANDALDDLRNGRLQGAAVLTASTTETSVAS